MGIVNIVDRRKRTYRFLKVNAIVEAAWHDNICKDSDQVKVDDGIWYAEQEHISIERAINWAQSYLGPVTLYVYDQDGGIYDAQTDSD